MVNRERERTWKILLFAVSAALLTAGAIAALQPHQHSVRKVILSYNEVLDYKVIAYPKSNNPFGSQPAIDPSTIYTNVTQSVNFTLEYQLSKNLAANTNLTLAERVSLVSANPDWTDVVYSNLTYYSVGPSQIIVRSIPVNMSQAVAKAENIDAALGLGYDAPSLVFNTTVEPSGLPSLGTGMTVRLFGSEELLSIAAANSSQGNIYSTQSVDPSPILPLTQGIGFGMISAGIVAGAAASFLTIRALPRPSEMEKLKKEKSDWIIEINSSPGKKWIRVNNQEGIFKMAELFEVPVFVMDDRDMIYIVKDGNYYYSELKK